MSKYLTFERVFEIPKSKRLNISIEGNTLTVDGTEFTKGHVNSVTLNCGCDLLNGHLVEPYTLLKIEYRSDPLKETNETTS